MNVQVIRDEKTLESCFGEWNIILSAIGNNDPYITPDWMKHWLKHFGANIHLHVLRVSDHGQVIGFLPLMIMQGRFAKTYKIIGSPQRARLIVRPGYEEEFIQTSIGRLQSEAGCAVFRLTGFIREDAAYPLLVKALQGKAHYVQSLPCHLVRTNTATPGEYAKQIKKHYTIRKTLSGMNALSKLVELTFREAAPDEIEQIFPLHEKRWSRKNDGNGFGKGASKEFFAYIAKLAQPSQWRVRVFLLSAGRRLIGFIYAVECGNRATIYRLAHDDDFAYYKPGMMICHKVIEHYFKKEFDVIDFSTGDEQYKRFFANGCETVDQIVFGADNRSSDFAVTAARTKYAVRQLLKKSDLLLRMKNDMLGKIKYLLSGKPARECICALRTILSQRSPGNILLSAARGIVKEYQYPRIYNMKKVRKSVDCPFTVYEASLNDLDMLRRLMAVRPDAIVRRYHKASQCRVLRANGRPVGYAWLSDTEIADKDRIVWKKDGTGDCCYYGVRLFKSLGKKRAAEAIGYLVWSTEKESVRMLVRGSDYGLERLLTHAHCIAEHPMPNEVSTHEAVID